MTASILALTNAIAEMVPQLGECSSYRDEADSKATLPWIVTTVSLQGRETSESLSAQAGHGFIETRIAAHSVDQVNLFADLTDVTGLTPHAEGFSVGALVPYADSGVYLAPLTDDLTSKRVPIRVMRWRFTWSRTG